MDCSWMKTNILSMKNENGVVEFLDFYKENFLKIKEFFNCPCVFLQEYKEKKTWKEINIQPSIL